MKSRKKVILIMGIFLFLHYPDIFSQQNNILVLHSYNTGLSWTDNINKGIFETFKDEFHKTIDIRCEYMDAKNFEKKKYFDFYKNYIEFKYRDIKIDLIICSDNAAFDFLSQNHNILFKDVPVVFCGVNYCDSVPKGFTGIIEDIDIYTNLQTILSTHPDYEKLYIINDRSITGSSISKELNHIIASKFQNLRYEFLTDYSVEELENKLTTLNKKDIVLMLLFNFDRLGKAYSYDSFLDEITPYCKVPMYGTWDFYLGKGIVGGKITNAYDHGVMASNIAKSILAGKKIQDIKVVNGPSKFMYDYRMVKKFNINMSKLPENSEFINLPLDFIRKNKLFFTFLALIFLLFVIFITVLYIQVKRIKISLKKEKMMVATIEQKSKELTEALDKAEQSNKLKAAFISNISHEVRTPLNGILGFTDLLSDEHEPIKQEKYISTIRMCGEQLLNIIEDILNISIIESNQIKLNEDIINVNQEIRDICFTFSKTSKSNTKIIQGNFDLIDSECNIITDSIKFREILNNLVSNAFKFTENGVIEIGYKKRNLVLEFYVKDNGIGISQDNHEIIFERFRQVEHHNLKVYRGNGLGLSISKAYIKLLGGNIWLNSELNKGSVFYFTIPAKFSETKSKINQKEAFKHFPQNLIVLVAEDDDNNYLYLKEILTRQVSEIIHARNGNEAVNIVKSRKDIGLILMDIKMPEMDGFDATRIIRSYSNKIPIIAQSAFYSSSEFQNVLAAGFDDFITKPINRYQLLNKISQYVLL
jgi:signal transduction histidine kinase/ABC-type uncharacterized transport system substrate-binding protein